MDSTNSDRYDGQLQVEQSELPTTSLDIVNSSEGDACQNEVELQTTPLDTITIVATTRDDLSNAVERSESFVEKLAKCVSKHQLVPGSVSLKDTSLKGPGVCMFTYHPEKSENFGYFFIKKGSELWNEYERAHPRIGELFASRKNPHDLICIGVTLDTKKPFSEEVVFSYYSFHTHELLMML
jgi:hypothetical protein